uniref:NADH-ubiquinone oxidoreductase chain 5 n=1 Tax=Salmostoma bacalia TaxID=497986 RepID=F3Y696_9TELE|nr:NADH dehydrogenase subunit 5 [Salmostoma bacalia]BAK22897.1 NADH dehydrogenase subunit 5 [Salmostoma bacalia]
MTHASMMFLAFLILISPLLLALLPGSSRLNWPSITTAAVRAAFIASTIALTVFIYKETNTTIVASPWISTQSFHSDITFKLDQYTMVFTPVALFVTLSILDFANWYMDHDPEKSMFFKYLLLFLVFMITLISTNNLLQLFVGWEGVGTMSFLLIGWWYGRPDANTASLQAVIYNRTGDIGYVIALAWTAMYLNTWNVQQIMVTSEGYQLILPTAGLIIAATGKSAQFTLHPWLPAAMEGPTPVSALLHSSTMVVAGIFLLVRFHPFMENNQMALTTCLCLGALTTLFAATCALTQNDIKKIVAFSTSSQLGLMMVTLGLNQPQLAFLHICLHAFFKAMLFLCSGAIIHNMNDEQDIRKMGCLYAFMPVTTTCFMIGNLALVGTPFLTGFFSKDAIIEALNTSYLNAGALYMTLLATTFTAVYSFRVVYLVSFNYPRWSSPYSMSEKDIPLSSIRRLAWGSIIAGLLIFHNLVPYKTPTMTMPLYIKLTALLLMIIGFLLAKEIILYSQAHKNIKPKALLYYLFTVLWYYSTITHRVAPQQTLNLSRRAMEVEKLWMEKLGPTGLTILVIKLIMRISENKQTIKSFLMAVLVTLVVALVIIIF